MQTNVIQTILCVPRHLPPQKRYNSQSGAVILPKLQSMTVPLVFLISRLQQRFLADEEQRQQLQQQQHQIQHQLLMRQHHQQFQALLTLSLVAIYRDYDDYDDPDGMPRCSRS